MGASDKPWYVDDSELVFTECVILLVMITITTLFDIIHHKIQHRVSPVVSHATTTNEYKARLFHRTNGEFMVLGFLTLLVWSGNKASLYKVVASLPAANLGPNAASDLLHLIEDVHIQLFLAMLLYMGSLIRIIRASEVAMGKWKVMEDDAHTDPDPGKAVQHYKMMRGIFIAWVKHGGGFDTPPEGFGGQFNFGEYLTRHLDILLDELLQMKQSTWLVIATIYVLVGVLAAFAQLGDDILAVINGSFFGMFVIITGAVLLFDQHQQMVYKHTSNMFDRHAESEPVIDEDEETGLTDEEIAERQLAELLEAGIQKGATTKATQSFNRLHTKKGARVVLVVFHIVQALLFVMCHVIARLFSRAESYRRLAQRPETALYFLMAGGLYALVQWKLFPLWALRFSFMMALPPNVDDFSKELITQVAADFPNRWRDNRGVKRLTGASLAATFLAKRTRNISMWRAGTRSPSSRSLRKLIPGNAIPGNVSPGSVTLGNVTPKNRGSLGRPAASLSTLGLTPEHVGNPKKGTEEGMGLPGSVSDQEKPAPAGQGGGGERKPSIALGGV